MYNDCFQCFQMVRESFFLTGQVSDNGQCPGPVDCGQVINQSLSSFSIGSTPCYVGIVSDSLSIVASIVIIAIYIAWKDIRVNTSQAIVTFIAISDFCTAAAYLGGSINLLSSDFSHHVLDSESCDTFKIICAVESYIVTCATMSSYFWTMILAFHLYLIIVLNRSQLARKLLPAYHIVAWGLPTLNAFPLLCFNKLSFAPFVTGVWCYIEIYHASPPYTKNDIVSSVLVELPEVTAFIVMILFFMATRIYILLSRYAISCFN